MSRSVVTGNDSSLPSPRRRYKWHHIVVSILCVCALAGVVSSLFTTINSIHNMKKKRSLDKREISKRSVEISNDTGVDSSGNDQSFNVMEINQSINDQPKNLTSNRTIDEIVPGIARNTSVVEATLLAGNATRSNMTEEAVESEFESGSDSDEVDDTSSGASSDQVDSIDSTSNAGSSASETTDTEKNSSTESVKSTETSKTETIKPNQESAVKSPKVTKIDALKPVPNTSQPTAKTAQHQNVNLSKPQNQAPLTNPRLTSPVIANKLTGKRKYNETDSLVHQEASNSTEDSTEMVVESQISDASSGDDEVDDDTESSSDGESSTKQPEVESHDLTKQVTPESTKPKVSKPKVPLSNQAIQTNSSNSTNTASQSVNTAQQIRPAILSTSIQQQSQSAKAMAQPNPIKPSQTQKQPLTSANTNAKLSQAISAAQISKNKNPVSSQQTTLVSESDVDSPPKETATNSSTDQQQTVQQKPQTSSPQIQNEGLHLTPIKNKFHFANQTVTESVRNTTSSLYEPTATRSEKTTSTRTQSSSSPTTEARNINEDHKEKPKEDDYPSFPTNYHASGIIILPESKIAEPFEIWYSQDQKKSRIDYYYGNDKTFQRGDQGDYGISYKYVPMFNDQQKNFDGCYTITGTPNRRIIAQVITPNMTWFKYNKTEVYTGVLTTKWTYKYTAYGMKNYQSVWVTKSKPYRPIRYEMFGFDMMLGSYYDNYVINYVSFEEWTPTDDVFVMPQGIQCSKWSNSLESSLIVNPMQEFTAFRAEDALDHSQRYSEFKEKHYKNKGHPHDADKRKHVFKHNARYIHSHNRRNLSFKLKPNMFADKFDKELEHFHGALEKDTRNHEGVKEFHKIDNVKTSSHPPDQNIPEELDWRDYGAVSSVSGQGICGSCYAFSAAEAVEGAWYRKTSKMVRLSKQQLVDCSWGFGNHGCKGGHYAAALSWVYVHGISTAKSYGKYLGQEGYCHFNDTWFGANIEGFTYVPIWNATALKRAITNHGPVAVSINTLPLSFKFYGKGIYNDPKCSKNMTTHSALVIGYGKENGQEYWIVKNSWSALWGENGYIRVAMKDDLCGITEYPVAVIVKHPSFHLPVGMKNVNNNKEDDENEEEVEDKIPNDGKISSEVGKNIPLDPSGTNKKPKKQMPGNLDNDDVTKQSPNDDQQEDEDEKEEKKQKQSHKKMLEQYRLKEHEHETSMFEKTLQQVEIPFKGLHIEDIGNDIKKIHELLVNTAEADKAFANNDNDKKKSHTGSHGDLSDVHPVNTESRKTGKSGQRVTSKNTKIRNKAQVSSPARPAFGTSNQGTNKPKNKKKLSKDTPKQTKNTTKTKKKQRQKMEIKKEFNDLIKNLDTKNEATKSAIKKPSVTNTNNLKTNPKILNPEKIGSLSHSAKRSKTVRPTKSDRGSKRTTISRLDKKQRLNRQQRISKKNSQKITKKSLRKNNTKKSKSSGRYISKSNDYLPYATPVRRTMDIHFIGAPSSNIDHYLLKEHQNLRKEFKSKRKNISKRRKSGRMATSHKRERIQQQSAMDIAKQDSMDSLYSFINKKVQEYTSTQVEPAKKRDMNYYKHHIHNGK